MTAQMVEVKTAELEGAALDWAVAVADGVQPTLWDVCCGNGLSNGNPSEPPECCCNPVVEVAIGFGKWAPSTDWAQGGPLIESNSWALPYRATHRYHIGAFEACTPGGFPHNGATPLIAACRAIVAAKLGDSVMVPAELVKS